MQIDAAKAGLTALALANILGWSSFFAIVFLTNPKSAGGLGAAVLYLSLAVGLSSLAVLIWKLRALKKK